MSWIITRDLLNEADPDPNIGTRAGTGCDIEALRAVPKEERITFRLLDDDMEHYYTGQADRAAYEIDEDQGGSLYTAYCWAMTDAGVTHCCISLETAKSFGGNLATYADQMAFKTGPHKGWVSLYS